MKERPNDWIGPFDKGCLWCGSREWHFCGTPVIVSEIEQDRNWWKNESASLQRRLDEMQARLHRTNIRLDDALRCAHTGQHAWLPLHEASTTPDGPLYCSLCGLTTEVSPP